MKWEKLVLGSATAVFLLLMVTPLIVNLSSTPLPRAADTPDGYNPNHTFSTAHVISAGLTNNLYVDHDDDWFYIFVANSYRLSVNLNWTGGSDLDLYLYDSNQVRLNSSNGLSNPEKVSYEVMEPGYYYIRVIKYSGVETLYSLYVNNSVRTQYKLFTLLDAYFNSNMSVSIHGTGSLYASSLTIEVEWVSGFAEYSGVRTYIPLGLIVKASSSSYTEMVIAYPITVTLTYTGAWDLEYVYAFSTEIGEDAPLGSTDLSPYGYYTASSDTYKVLQYCASYTYYYTHEGQVAVWVTTEGEAMVTSEYYSSYEVDTINDILSDAGTSLQLNNNYLNPPIFFIMFIGIFSTIIVIIIIAVAVTVKRKGGFSRPIAVKPGMAEQPYMAPPAYRPPPQPPVVPQVQPAHIWSQPTFQQASVPRVASPSSDNKDRFCPSCGARLDVGERFCHNCGIETDAK